MTWKTAYRSFYYEGAPEPEDMVLPAAETAQRNIGDRHTQVRSGTTAAYRCEHDADDNATPKRTHMIAIFEMTHLMTQNECEFVLGFNFIQEA